MTGWWWVALFAVVVAALVASIVDGRARAAGSRRRRGGGRRGPGGGSAPARPAGPGPGRTATGGRTRAEDAGVDGRPRPGEIWWARVPYEDGPGAKDRPCLVLRVGGERVRVAKITTKHHQARPGVIALPPGSVDGGRGRPSFLETDEVREVGVADFRRRAGALDPELWGRVRHLGGR